MRFPVTVWPGAVCDDWFGIFAFYTTCVFAIATAVLLVGIYGWLIGKLWRMRYRGESWWGKDWWE